MEKCPLSILSTQPYLFLAQISPQKYPLDLFPRTHYGTLGWVDNLDVISETRLNKGLQPRNQYYRLNMVRHWEEVHGLDLLCLVT